MNKFVIKQKLPSLNEYINVCRRNKYQAAKYKRDIESNITLAIIQAKLVGELKPTNKPVTVHIKWHEKTKRRDADNIVSAKKYILDAMQKTNIIPNDNRKYIKSFIDEIIDDTNDYVEVILIDEDVSQ